MVRRPQRQAARGRAFTRSQLRRDRAGQRRITACVMRSFTPRGTRGSHVALSGTAPRWNRKRSVPLALLLGKVDRGDQCGWSPQTAPQPLSPFAPTAPGHGLNPSFFWPVNDRGGGRVGRSAARAAVLQGRCAIKSASPSPVKRRWPVRLHRPPVSSLWRRSRSLPSSTLRRLRAGRRQPPLAPCVTFRPGLVSLLVRDVPTSCSTCLALAFLKIRHSLPGG